MKPILAGMLSVSGYTLNDFEKRLLEKANPMGITLFKRNVESKNQVQQLVASVKEVIGREDVLIAVDQEGGRVCRFAEPEWNTYLSQYALGSLNGAEQEELIRLHGRLIARDLHELGVNWNYAPVMDVRYEQTADVLKSRTFSEDAKTVAKCGEILLDIYRQNGICSCIKHLPGHGRTQMDPHLNLPIISDGLDELKKDFYPFMAVANKAVAGMTAHIVLSALDDKPVTQSKKVITDIIRREIGFDGFLISDAIDMKALGGSLTHRVENCLDAGCDAVCYCLGRPEELSEVVGALPPLTDLALGRLEKIRQIVCKPYENNVSETDYERYQALGQKTHSLASDYDAVEVLNQMKGKANEN